MCSQAWITKIRQMDKGTDGQKLGDLCRTHFARCSNKRNCFIERKIDNVVSIYNCTVCYNYKYYWLRHYKIVVISQSFFFKIEYKSMSML